MIFTGYVVGIDKTKFYSIIIDTNNKSYQMDCELKHVNIQDIKMEREFIFETIENEFIITWK